MAVAQLTRKVRHIMLYSVPGFIWFLIAVILVLVILGMVFGRSRRV